MLTFINLKTGAKRMDVSQYSLQYDRLCKEDSSHTGEISAQVACNAACVQGKYSCKCEREMHHKVYVCLCKQSRVGMSVCVYVSVIINQIFS